MEQLTDSAINESGYVCTALMHIVVTRRICRPYEVNEIVDAVLAVVAECTERTHVVAVLRADRMEACVCTVHGMRWAGKRDPPKVVLKLMGVPAEELPVQRRGSHGRRETRSTPDATDAGVGYDEVACATLLFASWQLLWTAGYLLYAGGWLVCRLCGQLVEGSMALCVVS